MRAGGLGIFCWEEMAYGGISAGGIMRLLPRLWVLGGYDNYMRYAPRGSVCLRCCREEGLTQAICTARRPLNGLHF